MGLYAGFDLHSNKSYVGIIDETGKRIFKKKLPSEPAMIKEIFGSSKSNIEGIVAESTYNSYFLVDQPKKMLHLGILQSGLTIKLLP